LDARKYQFDNNQIVKSFLGWRGLKKTFCGGPDVSFDGDADFYICSQVIE
jgi:hypothetical protein